MRPGFHPGYGVPAETMQALLAREVDGLRQAGAAMARLGRPDRARAPDADARIVARYRAP